MRLIAALMLVPTAACAARDDDEAFRWPETRDALPDAQTAINIAILIFNAQMRAENKLDPVVTAPKLQAVRHGNEWFVKPTDQEDANFMRECRRSGCIGGELFWMGLSAHDGRVIEFYIPQ